MSGCAVANSYRQQVERIDRLMTIIEADSPHEMATGLLTIDVIMLLVATVNFPFVATENRTL